MRLGIKTTHAFLVYETMVITLFGVEYNIWVCELNVWIPKFVNGFKEQEDENKSVTS